MKYFNWLVVFLGCVSTVAFGLVWVVCSLGLLLVWLALTATAAVVPGVLLTAGGVFSLSKYTRDFMDAAKKAIGPEVDAALRTCDTCHLNPPDGGGCPVEPLCAHTNHNFWQPRREKKTACTNGV